MEAANERSTGYVSIVPAMRNCNRFVVLIRRARSYATCEAPPCKIRTMVLGMDEYPYRATDGAVTT
jgi:hypothetical protein